MFSMIASIVYVLSIVGACTIQHPSEDGLNVKSSDLLKMWLISLIPVVNTALCMMWCLFNPLKVRNFLKEIRNK